MFTEIDVKLRNDLLLLADAYAEATGLSASTISKRFHGNGGFIDALRNGSASVTIGKLREIVDLLSDLWPKDTAWPKTIVLRRPSPRGTVYVIRWKENPHRIKFGYTANFERRALDLRREAKAQGDELLIVILLPGTIRNEQSIHRFLTPHAMSKGLRGWYNSTPTVEALCRKLQNKDFAWGRCQELIEADIAGDKKTFHRFRNKG